MAQRRSPAVSTASPSIAPTWGTLGGSAASILQGSEVRLTHEGATKIQEKFIFDSEAGIHSVASPGHVALGSGAAMTQTVVEGVHDASKVAVFGSKFLPGGQRKNTEWKFKSTNRAHTSHTAIKKRWHVGTDIGYSPQCCDMPYSDFFPGLPANSDKFLQTSGCSGLPVCYRDDIYTHWDSACAGGHKSCALESSSRRYARFFMAQSEPRTVPFGAQALTGQSVSGQGQNLIILAPAIGAEIVSRDLGIELDPGLEPEVNTVRFCDPTMKARVDHVFTLEAHSAKHRLSFWEVMIFGTIFGTLVPDTTSVSSDDQWAGQLASGQLASGHLASGQLASGQLASDGPADDSSLAHTTFDQCDWGADKLNVYDPLSFYLNCLKMIGELMCSFFSWVYMWWQAGMADWLVWRVAVVTLTSILVVLLISLHNVIVRGVHADYMQLVPKLRDVIKRAHRSAKKNARALAKFESFRYRRFGRLSEQERRELKTSEMVAEDFPRFHNFVYIGTWLDLKTGWPKCQREGCLCVSHNGKPGYYCSRYCRDGGDCSEGAHPTPSSFAQSSRRPPARRGLTVAAGLLLQLGKPVVLYFLTVYVLHACNATLCNFASFNCIVFPSF